MSALLSKVTVIIPAHNRPERLQRLLDYYRGTDIRVLVPDSSTERFDGTWDAGQVTYRHYPRMHFLLKLRRVMPLIDTPYVLYCADDDFAVPTGIEAVVDFLENNPGYSTAQGHYLTFVPGADGRVRFYPRYIRNHDSRVTGNGPLERLPRQRGMYASMLYGVTRTGVFRQMYSYCFDADGDLRFKNLFLAEEFFNHAVLMHGDYATVPVFFSARERIPGSATDTTVPLSVIKTAPQYRAEFDGFVEALALMLADTVDGGMEIDRARQFVRSLSLAPIDTAPVTFKRRVNAFLGRHRWLGWASRLSVWRYNQKGRKAVRGMASYPIDGNTPQTRAIIAAVKSTRPTP